jgi:predicted nucleotidyltransferase component of viral defense system
MAGEEDAIVRLCEHPDFDQAVLLAAAHFEAKGLRPAIVEKDYFVTEALRSVARVAGDRVIFKGGTSLSKGWDLIDRFSEDIDLFLDPQTIGRPLSPRGVDRE